MALSGKQRRALRALGHHLNPVVLIGKDGIDEGVVSAANQALDDHELIKVKVGEASPLDRHEVADELSEQTGAEIAQVLGRTILLFRRNPEKPKVSVPGMPMPTPPEKPEPERPARRNTAGKKAAKKSAVRKGATSRKTTRKVVRRRG